MLVGFAGCKDKTSATSKTASKPAMMNSGHGPGMQQQTMSDEHKGKVVETMNASRYTYVLVDDGQEKIWAAAPQFQVKVGDEVVVPQGVPMKNYHSSTLNRDFETVYFVPRIINVSSPNAQDAGSVAEQKKNSNFVPAGMQSLKTSDNKVDFSGIKKAAGGQTIAELYSARDSLAGKKIKVRGKVVKFSPQIMGRNWIHIKDGTGSAGTNDLTVTTDKKVNIGDTILVSGVLVKDKDFGYGYKYDLIVENASVTVE